MATTDYVKMALAARRGVNRLTLAQQAEIIMIYGEAISRLAEKASKSRKGSLTERWALDYAEGLALERIQMQKNLEESIKQGISNAADYGVQFDYKIFVMLKDMTNIDFAPRFKEMFSFASENAVKPILTGKLYKDGKSLSQRIWNIGNAFEKDVQYIINQGLIEKKSAVELADDLKQYVKEPAKRLTDWGKVYPNLRSKQVDYNAQRLARTSINHAYQTATIRSAGMNPFVEGVEWHSAMEHGRTCDLCMERHGQIFPKEDVPLDHANGLCTMIPYIPKSLNQVAGELRHWVDGGHNPKLDRWYKEYGEYFAFKKL